ncbi:MAG: hypothetical protein ACKOE6_16575 [Flammeovirgaceae bacterium]
MVTLTFYNYQKNFGWLGFLAMGWMRFPLSLNSEITFWKLMGVGQPGFKPQGDGRQWAVLIVWKKNPQQKKWWQRWMAAKADVTKFLLQPLFGHGLWSGVDPFKPAIAPTSDTQKVAVLTRASIRWGKAKLFLKNVPAVADDLNESFRPIFTAGIGEIPVIRQATFSVWNSEAEMKKFAYQHQAHKKVIELTKQHNWYSEELFYRFAVVE